MNIDLKAIQSRIEKKLILSKRHPSLPLTIYKYSNQCVYGGNWDFYTKICRGLVLDDFGKIITYPFEKFFNIEDYAVFPKEFFSEKYEVTEKLDGSLINVSYYNGIPIISSSGSFESEQAIKAAEMLKGQLALFNKNVTYMFEIIYPENRIVVDYGDMEQIILIGLRDNIAGREFPWGIMSHESQRINLPCVPKLTFSLEECREVKSGEKFINSEGFVIRFNSGFRIKIKYDEYFRLHKLISMTNEKFVWEFLSKNKSMEKALVNVPDEVYKFIKETSGKLTTQYDEINKESKKIFNFINEIDRKGFAKKAVQSKYSAILFRMFDNKDYSQYIWKLLKPEVVK